MGDFIEECFDGKTGVRMADGAPPLNGHADLRRVQVDLEIGKAVKDIGSAFNGSAVNAVLDSEGGERRAVSDGLADDGVRPGDRVAVGVEARDKAIVPHGAIPAAAHVVFAGPDDFDGSFRDFGDVRRFDDKIGGRIGAPAETSAEKHRVNLDFFGRQADDSARRWRGRRFQTACRSRFRRNRPRRSTTQFSGSMQAWAR